MTGAVERWFGDGFAALHPALQRLHRDGGRLSGALDVDYGRGLARLAGRRLARRLGLRHDGGNRIEVDIRSDADTLYWDRVLNGSHRFASRFVPVGRAPDGYWQESTGALTLLLGVEVADGAWHWRPRGARWLGLPLPRWLAPRGTAWKAVHGERYRFRVELALPLLGTVLCYGGDLALSPRNVPDAETTE